MSPPVELDAERPPFESKTVHRIAPRALVNRSAGVYQVETSHILPEHDGSRYPGSPALRVTERFSLMEGGEIGKQQLVDDITITDPLVYTQPIHIRMVYKPARDVEVGEYICNEDIWGQHRDGSTSKIPWR